MTLEQRIEAAATALALSEMSRGEQAAYLFAGAQPQAIGQTKRGVAKNALRAAFPELFANTHKIVPIEPTEKMVAAGMQCADVDLPSEYRAMIEAAP